MKIDFKMMQYCPLLHIYTLLHSNYKTFFCKPFEAHCNYKMFFCKPFEAHSNYKFFFVNHLKHMYKRTNSQQAITPQQFNKESLKSDVYH